MPATAPVLMAPNNPTGWKLEDLLAQLCAEVREKCARISHDTESDDTAFAIYGNNLQIIQLLGEAEMLQRENFRLLHEKKGPDQGPTGKPRIGVARVTALRPGDQHGAGTLA